MSPARKGKPQDGGDFINFGESSGTTDPAVNALLGQAERRQAEARLSRREREKKKKEREKIRVELRERIKAIAEQHAVPASQVATLGLLLVVQALDDGQVDLNTYKVPSRSPRYDWNLVLPVEEVLGNGGKRRRK
jgi:hypothetical protein